MVLSEKDGQLFYKLWMPLLDYVNEKYRVNKNLKNMARANALDPKEVKKIADVLWNHVSTIDEYLLEYGSELSLEEREIIASWKNCVQGQFLMERHLKKGTIFIDEDNSVYQVYGIISSWEEMFMNASLPILVDATLIPFRDVIISDGLVISYPIYIGRNMKKQLRDIYMDAKNNKCIIKSVHDMKLKNVEQNKWKKLDKLIGKCYSNIVDGEDGCSCWKQTFDILIENVMEERKNDPQFGLQLELLEEEIEYASDIQGWLEDCLDEIDIQEDYETLLHMCETLLELFEWGKDAEDDIKFRKSIALTDLNRLKDAIDFGEQWLKEDSSNYTAATAIIYSYIKEKKYDEAEQILNKFLENETECTDENNLLFIAGSRLYGEMGKKKEKKKLDKEIQKYEELIKEYFLENDYEDEEWEDEYPFF